MKRISSSEGVGRDGVGTKSVQGFHRFYFYKYKVILSMNILSVGLVQGISWEFMGRVALQENIVLLCFASMFTSTGYMALTNH